MKPKSDNIVLMFFLILIFQFGMLTNSANAEIVYLPDWVLNLYYFWIDKKISDNELVNAINYLEDKNIIDLIMHKEYDTKSNFLLSVLQLDEFNSESKFGSCTSEWYITGYFVPVEADYSGKLIDVTVNGENKQYDTDFVDVVRIEGWGKTNSGWYLGWYDDSYHLSYTPLDSHDNPLVAGMIAVDTSLIKHGSDVLIPTLPKPWDSIVFSAMDVGPAIVGKHIDVFTGEGLAAENETFRITDYNNKVCVKK